jgi:hypothetical protein
LKKDFKLECPAPPRSLDFRAANIIPPPAQTTTPTSLHASLSTPGTRPEMMMRPPRKQGSVGWRIGARCGALYCWAHQQRAVASTEKPSFVKWLKRPCCSNCRCKGGRFAAKNVGVVALQTSGAGALHAHDDPRRNRSAHAPRLGRPWIKTFLGRVYASEA